MNESNQCYLSFLKVYAYSHTEYTEANLAYEKLLQEDVHIFYIIKKLSTITAAKTQLESKIFQTIYYTCNFASMHKFLAQIAL